MQALDFLKSDELLAEVEAQIAEAREKGVTGVPFTIIDGKWAVSGGQQASVYVKVRVCFFYIASPVAVVLTIFLLITVRFARYSSGS